MLRTLLILGLLAWNGLGGPHMAKCKEGPTHAGDRQAANNQSVMPPQGTVVNPALTRPCGQTEPYHKKDDAPQSTLPEWRRPEWVIIYVTVIYAGIAGWTLGAIKRQADLMEDTAQRQLRAYVCLVESSVKITKAGEVVATLLFKNGGQTPAYNVSLWALPLVDPYPLVDPPGPPPAEIPLPKGIVASQGTQILVSAPLTLPSEVLARFSERDYALYFFGEVTYRDVFFKEWTLTYRLLFGGPAGIEANRDEEGNIVGTLCMDTEGNEENPRKQS